MRYKVDFEIDLKKHNYPGLYIALEGIDGSGKTTQAKALSAYFKKKGKEVFITSEPTRDGDIGKLIHKILKTDIKVPRFIFQYLFSADRGINQTKVIIPKLKKGKVIISHRTLWSTLAYGMLDVEEERKVKKADRLLVAYSILSFYHRFIVPDITIYLDVEVDNVMDRLSKRKTEKELYENKKMLSKIKKNYDFMMKKFKNEFVVVNGNVSEKKVTEQIINNVEKVL